MFWAESVSLIAPGGGYGISQVLSCTPVRFDAVAGYCRNVLDTPPYSATAR